MTPDETTLDTLREKIARAENLPTLPAVALEVLRLASAEDTSIRDLAAAISRDPVLAAKLLQLANSSMFRRGSDATTLDEATMRLGIKTVKLMALTFSLAESMPRSGAASFDYGAFWRRSIVTTVSARSFARLVGSSLEDEAYLAGLLSGIGQLVLIACDLDRYTAVLERSASEAPEIALEHELLGIDHFRVGALMLEQWKLPKLIVEPLVYLGDIDTLPEDADAEVRDLARILYLSTITTRVICDAKKGRALAELRTETERLFDISERECDAFAIGLESGVVETAALLNIEVDTDADHEKILDLARTQLLQLSFGTAADLQATADRADRLEEENRELATKASTDALTGLPNRASFESEWATQIDDHQKNAHEKALGILLLDIDHFKSINDTHGHQVGDRVLEEVGRTLADLTRRSDFAARYGGEEFVMILPQVGREAIEAVAERVRMGIEAMVVDLGDKSLQVTISVGGACSDRVGSARAAETLLSKADECLYRAKGAGRNCTTVDFFDSL